jgi:hypothetical protein
MWHRLGVIGLSVVGIGIGLLGVYRDWPLWGIALVILLTVVLAGLAYQFTNPEATAKTAFIDGPVTDAEIMENKSNAERFIAGSVRRVRVGGNTHTPRSPRVSVTAFVVFGVVTVAGFALFWLVR